jgi:hypothetical protein
MLDQTSARCKSCNEMPIGGKITRQTEKAGYILWEDDFIFEEGANMTMLLEMEKGNDLYFKANF